MKFSVEQIKRSTHSGPFTFAEQVDVSELESMNNDIRTIGSVHVNGKAEAQGNDIIFTFTIEGQVTLPCARTLVDVFYPLTINTVEVFSESTYEHADADDDIHPIDSEVIDLRPLIKENILLELPYRVFSDDEQATSQVPLQGEGWKLTSQEDHGSSIDPRLAKLASLLEDKEKE